jgi:prolipoprotein diacylglyceryl transferase
MGAVSSAATGLLASIPSPSSNGFSIGPIFFHAYGIMYVLAVAAAIFISRWRWAKIGGNPDLPYEVAIWAFPAGLIGGRIYFDITTPSQIPDHWWGVFAVWDGGLGIWGGIVGGVLVGLWVVHRRLSKDQRRWFMDIVGPALLVSQAIGRIGNYFNQELFGKPSSLPWALRISPAHRPPGYAHFTAFEPTFLYEFVWDLGLAGFLMWLWTKRVVRAPGLFALYVAGYSGFRVFEETQRIDFSNYFLGMRVNFWIASGLCVAGLVSFVIIQLGLWGRGCEPAVPAPPLSMIPGGRAAKTSLWASSATRPAVATAPAAAGSATGGPARSAKPASAQPPSAKPAPAKPPSAQAASPKTAAKPPPPPPRKRGKRRH